MAKRPNLRRIKSNQAYSVEELADTVDVTEQTVRHWIKAGMVVLDSKRPTLIMGIHALDFLGDRQAKAKIPLAIDQFYCLKCKAPRRPMGMMADFSPASSGGRLSALCEQCGGRCNRSISSSQFAVLSEILEIATRASA